MARPFYPVAYPLDVPTVPGDNPVREADMPGSDKFALDSEEETHPLRVVKGDLGFSRDPAPAPPSGGAPFANLRKR